MMNRLLSWSLLASFVLLPLVARAQQDTPLAKQYYRLGAELYKRADFEGALAQFRKSFELSRRPALHYNMARCQESLGQYGQAIKSFEQYLKSTPSDAAVVQMRMRNLQKLVDKRRAAQPAPAPAPASQPDSQGTISPNFAAQAGGLRQPPDPAPAPRSKTMRLAGYTAAGVGGALIITGVVLGSMASAKADELQTANESGNAYWTDWQTVQADGEALEAGQIGTLVAGGVLLAAGATLVLLDMLGQRKEQQAWVAPAVTPGGGMAAAGVSF